jgi:hypothetical protein
VYLNIVEALCGCTARKNRGAPADALPGRSCWPHGREPGTGDWGR